MEVSIRHATEEFRTDVLAAVETLGEALLRQVVDEAVALARSAGALGDPVETVPLLAVEIQVPTVEEACTLLHRLAKAGVVLRVGSVATPSYRAGSAG